MCKIKETKNRKKLRANPVAPWELRIGNYRIFYEVDNDSVKVIIILVGAKEHNILFIRGKRVKI
jgi:mRNA interferase RelE/StbE